MVDLDLLSPEFEALFRPLRKNGRSVKPGTQADTVYFRLERDDYGFYVICTDGSGNEIEPIHEYHSGPEREILKELSRIRETNAFRIEWGDEKSPERCYLSENEHLISLLLKSDRFQTADGKAIKGVEEEARLEAIFTPIEVAPAEVLPTKSASKKAEPSKAESGKISPAKIAPTDLAPIKKGASAKAEATEPTPTKGGRGDAIGKESDEKLPPTQQEYTCDFRLAHKEDRIDAPTALTPTCLIAGETLYTVKPMGPHFDKLSLFETTVRFDLLEQFLTLLVSTVRHLSIHCHGFKTVKGEPQYTRPTIIFENVTPDSTLNMRVAATYPGYAPGFFEQYEIDTMVSCQEMEKRLVISRLDHEDTAACLKTIQTALRKHAKSIQSNNTFFSDENFIVVESDLASRFITQELSDLLTKYVVMGAEKLKAYKVKYVKPLLDVHLSHGIDFLEGEASLDFEGERLSLNDVLKAYQKNSYITLGDGTRALVNPEYMNKLSRLFKQSKSGVEVSFFDLPLVDELIDEKVSQQALSRSRDIFMGFNQLDRSKVSLPDLEATLRGYQVAGVKWLDYLHEHGLGGCLADDMGLGKTVQTIALLTSIYPSKVTTEDKKAEKAIPPSLIVMPKTLLFNWESELKKFAPHLSFTLYYGQDREIETAMTHQVILTTYAVVRNDIETLREKPFHIVVLDESQNIKNILSKTSKAAMLLNASHRLALSGTPIENNLSELYALFRFLNPAMFGTFNDFTRNYLTPIQKQADKSVTRELRRKIYPFILRRLKTDVLTDLPERMEQTLFVEMSDAQKSLYHQRREMYRHAIQEEIQKKGIQNARFFILQAMGELRQIASIPEVKTDDTIISPKREILMEHISDVVAGDHKVLVFANYLHALDCISNDLTSAGIDHLVMTGSTRDRSSVVNRFQNDDTCKALLMTLKTGGLGLNLTAADYVFLFDPWWNVAAENQAIDRAHRMGQKNTVFSYRLITRESIEEKIMKLQEVKRALFDSLISSDAASIKQLSEEDIDFVLGS